MKLVNLGCGNRFHKEWINLDFKSSNSLVQEFDLHKKLPFKDNSIDVIYSSHVLEHFSKHFAPIFLQECNRVLKPKGIIRVVVPNLEELMKNYIKFLQEAKKGNKEAKEKYHWTMIEIFDQMVRNFSGGEMYEYWKQKPMPQENFIIKRLGSEVKNALVNIKNNKDIKFRNRDIVETPEKIGKFRSSGEIHQWMYDEFSLRELLENTGFSNISKMDFDKSEIINFNKYLLDCEENKDIRKPDSLFMEAFKND